MFLWKLRLPNTFNLIFVELDELSSSDFESHNQLDSSARKQKIELLIPRLNMDISCKKQYVPLLSIIEYKSVNEINCY